MAQSPFLIDQLQIEPGSTGTRLIRRKTTDDSLEFSDGVAGALSLKQLAGINFTGLLTVGAGAGAQYTTIQSAIDAIPAGATPYTVLIGPGTYAETVTINRTALTLVGLGYPTVTQSSGSTLRIYAGGGVTPYSATVQGLNLTNSDVTAASACVLLSGGAGSDVGRDGIEFVDCNPNRTVAGKVVSALQMCIASFYRCSLNGTLAISTIDNCGDIRFYGVDGLSAYEFLYDSIGALPSLTTGDYRFYQADVGPSTSDPILAVTQEGGGSFIMSGSRLDGNVTFAGDRGVFVSGSSMGNLTLDDTVAVRMSGSNHGTVTAAVGATLSENIQQGIASFIAVDHVDVTFSAKQPNTTYVVSLEPNDYGTYISARSVSGFTITASGVTTADVPWTVSRASV
ncbi:MAG: hypothetical protein WC824_14005 [Bacteroidota bacterium]|jgi:hypothetical protein